MEQKNLGGRPSKFTPERRAAILKDIASRVPYQLAAEANGICEETLYDWLRTAVLHEKQGIESDFTRFSESLKKVEAKKIKKHLQYIRENAKNWQAHAWILERRWYKHFSLKAHEHDFNKRLDNLEQEQFEERIKKLENDNAK